MGSIGETMRADLERVTKWWLRGWRTREPCHETCAGGWRVKGARRNVRVFRKRRDVLEKWIGPRDLAWKWGSARRQRREIGSVERKRIRSWHSTSRGRSMFSKDWEKRVEEKRKIEKERRTVNCTTFRQFRRSILLDKVRVTKSTCHWLSARSSTAII